MDLLNSSNSIGVGEGFGVIGHNQKQLFLWLDTKLSPLPVLLMTLVIKVIPKEVP